VSADSSRGVAFHVSVMPMACYGEVAMKSCAAIDLLHPNNSVLAMLHDVGDLQYK